MGGPPADPAANKGATKKRSSNLIENGAPKKHDRRNPSPRRGNFPVGSTPMDQQQEGGSPLEMPWQQIPLREKNKSIVDPLVNQPQQQQQKLLENNTFGSLKDNETDITPANVPKNTKSGKKPTQQQAEQVPVRKEKCPPIFVKGDPPGMRPSLQKCIAQGLKCTFRLCTEGVKLQTAEMSHYRMVMAFLDERNIEYFTHDDPATKPLKVVLRGLDDMDVKDLDDELGHRGLRISNIYKLVRHDQKKKYRDQLYLIHLERGSITLKDLKTINVVNSTVVEWERYKPVHRDVTQCMNCFRFGHGTRNCRMAPRCKVCGDNHPSAECTALEESEPKCANCGDNHRATARSCPKRAEFIAIRKKASTRNQPKRGRSPAFNDRDHPEPLLGNNSKADKPSAPTPHAAGPSTTHQFPSSPPGYGRYQEGEAPPPGEALPPYTSEELVPIFIELVDRLRRCKTRIDQVYALGLFVIEKGL